MLYKYSPLILSVLAKPGILQNIVLRGKGCIHSCFTKKSILIESGPDFDVKMFFRESGILYSRQNGISDILFCVDINDFKV